MTDWKTGRQVDYEPKSASGTAQPVRAIHHWELAGPDVVSSKVSGDKTTGDPDEPDVIYRHLHLKFLISWHELMKGA